MRSTVPLAPDDIIPAQYNVTFKRPSTHPIDGAALRAQVRERGLDRFDEVIVLGGADYRKRAEEAFAGTGAQLRFPFAGLSLGKSLHATKCAVTSGRPFG